MSVCNIHISASPEMLSNGWAVFTVRDLTGTLLFVGIDKMATVFRLHGFPGDRQQPVTLDVVDIMPNKGYAMKRRSDEMRRHSVIAMFNGIVCLTTGERWFTAAETCKAHNIDPAALSRHLNGQSGFKTINGKKYARQNIC